MFSHSVQLIVFVTVFSHSVESQRSAHSVRHSVQSQCSVTVFSHSVQLIVFSHSVQPRHAILSDQPHTFWAHLLACHIRTCRRRKKAADRDRNESRDCSRSTPELTGTPCRAIPCTCNHTIAITQLRPSLGLASVQQGGAKVVGGRKVSSVSCVCSSTQ